LISLVALPPPTALISSYVKSHTSDAYFFADSGFACVTIASAVVFIDTLLWLIPLKSARLNACNRAAFRSSRPARSTFEEEKKSGDRGNAALLQCKNPSQ
jgi:hypothetical protein